MGKEKKKKKDIIDVNSNNNNDTISTITASTNNNVDNDIKNKSIVVLSDEKKESNKDEKTNSDYKLDPTFINIISGIFGKRQGFNFFSDMGPFCHVKYFLTKKSCIYL